MRELTEVEKNKIKLLTKNQVSLALIEPTETGLKKSIMDATGSVRSFLKENGIHNYDNQGQGPENKVQIDTKIYEDFSINNSIASLYRPQTKKGDPRIWFSGLTKVANPNDIVALIYYSGSFHIFNLTQLNVESLLNSNLINPLKELVSEINGKANEIAFELLSMLRKVASSGPIPSMVAADTSVGRTLETVLGIKINSSKEPDYRGIELKSFRSKKNSRKESRKTLFAQVPNWKISNFKSSAEILKSFGYWRGLDFKLNCTVSAINVNSQGLTLLIDSDSKQLLEKSIDPKIGAFAIWTLEKLHERLLTKHKETFWVSAETVMIDGKEHFLYKNVIHTRKPIKTQFDLLLERGIITLDHLIKKDTAGKVKERGPLFKIESKALGLLFPPSEKYKLI